MRGVGFEPTKHYAVDLETTPFDRSGNHAYNRDRKDSNLGPFRDSLSRAAF